MEYFGKVCWNTFFESFYAFSLKWVFVCPKSMRFVVFEIDEWAKIDIFRRDTYSFKRNQTYWWVNMHVSETPFKYGKYSSFFVHFVPLFIDILRKRNKNERKLTKFIPNKRMFVQRSVSGKQCQWIPTLKTIVAKKNTRNICSLFPFCDGSKFHFWIFFFHFLKAFSLLPVDSPFWRSHFWWHSTTDRLHNFFAFFTCHSANLASHMSVVCMYVCVCLFMPSFHVHCSQWNRMFPHIFFLVFVAFYTNRRTKYTKIYCISSASGYRK